MNKVGALNNYENDLATQWSVLRQDSCLYENNSENYKTNSLGDLFSKEKCISRIYINARALFILFLNKIVL